MTIESATRIAATWLTQQPWGHEFEVTGVQMENDLALVFWGSRTGELVAGNAPLLIDIPTGRVHVTGTGQPMQYYVTNFRVSGDPHIEPVAAARIVGWRTGAKKVSAVTLLKEQTHLGLAGAKASIDAVLEGREVEILPRQDVAARDLCAKLDEVGFIAKETLRPPK